MSYHYNAFFCGCFTATKTVEASALACLGWKREDASLLASKKVRHFYYEEYLNFCAAKSSQEGCLAWRYDLNVAGHKKSQEGKDIPYSITALHCYELPFNIVIFSFEIAMVTNDLDDIKTVAKALREMELPDEAREVLLRQNALFTGSKKEMPVDMLEFGYRLKFFQIVNSDAQWEKTTPAERRNILYQLGTLESAGVGSSGFCDQYVEKAIESHALSVFNNWDALSLLDSFTIYAFQSEAKFVEIWIGEYYRMIYIQSLFQKYYLQSLNQRFRAMIGKRKDFKLSALLKEFEQYEHSCQFHKISYTFLPLLIDEAMNVGLEIVEERNLISRYIKDIEKKYQSTNDALVNSLLAAISCMTMFSTIWDITCLLNQIEPYEDWFFGSSKLGYLCVSVTTLLLVLFLLGILVCRYKRLPLQRWKEKLLRCKGG